jgi:magnesium transporter
MPPETLLYTGNRSAASPAAVSTTCYDATHCNHRREFAPDLCPSDHGISWIDMRGLHDVRLARQIGDCFGIHPLALEDILNTRQRAKLEEYDNGLFFILPHLKLSPDTLELNHEQISLFVGKNFVVVFQEDPDDTFAVLRQRIEEGPGRIRSKGADYLAYSLVDTIVDHYYAVLDLIEERLIHLEEGIHGGEMDAGIKARLFELKRLIGDISHRIQPLREAITRFHRAEVGIISDTTRLYFRDVVDHVAQVQDQLERERESLINLEALNQAAVANRLNHVMRLLTLINTIFIPLSFLAGVYGMNFDHMPELHTRYGYFVVLGIMATATIGMLFYFKRQKWL